MQKICGLDRKQKFVGIIGLFVVLNDTIAQRFLELSDELKLILHKDLLQKLFDGLDVNIVGAAFS